MQLYEGFTGRKLAAYYLGEDLLVGKTVAANNDVSLPTNRIDTQMAKAAKRAERENPQERQARYLRMLDQFGEDVPPGELLTIKVGLAKSLMGED